MKNVAQLKARLQSTAAVPQRHHIDRRAHRLIADCSIGDDKDKSSDDLLTTRQVADWLGVSLQWLEIGRLRKYGPEFVRVGPRIIRYRRGVVIDWLTQRAPASTAEYRARAGVEA
jgi:hypothetical protein